MVNNDIKKKMRTFANHSKCMASINNSKQYKMEKIKMDDKTYQLTT